MDRRRRYAAPQDCFRFFDYIRCYDYLDLEDFTTLPLNRTLFDIFPPISTPAGSNPYKALTLQGTS